MINFMKSKSSDILIFIAFAVFVSHAWGQALPSLGALPPLMAEALARHPQVRMQQAQASMWTARAGNTFPPHR
jgi:hypothetical protein